MPDRVGSSTCIVDTTEDAIDTMSAMVAL